MKKNKTYRHEYAIGDVQGCYAALLMLLEKIKFDAKKDRLWFAGDLVARGEDSLAVLRLVKQLNEKGAAETVLGNHDINLLAVWRGFAKARGKDNTESVLKAKDCDELMHWLRGQPLLHFPCEKTLLCHAGIAPIWTIGQAKKLANEVEAVLAGNVKQLDKLLPALYGKQPDLWQDSLTGDARLRCITNYFTRMRLCMADGRLEFGFKGSLEDDMPAGFKPWFKWSVKRERLILFGHWAALEAQVANKKVRALDAGCVWGGNLLAYRLADKKVFAV